MTKIIGLTLLCILYSTQIYAKQSTFEVEDAAFLQASCLEATVIFDRQNEQGKFAALHTSMAEAMRAGYCIGVLQQYIKQQHNCPNYYQSNRQQGGIRKWLDLAKAVAQLSITRKNLKEITSNELIEEASCNG
ncbi:hypothetical protein H5232_06485 [Pseudoalteromonas sp. SG41-5]|uniref:hypothetical protein n=1 Tax=Pseudoalteromonas sp. SG41-5 TaxID=2760975 RepID=UPI0016026E1B|nr:hypothetical protein [Pseudoalteromonas sp. SG41-5]MBB1468110.1 hypothetical protein [Pseudoalteromonas sp. SG41-5]